MNNTTIILGSSRHNSNTRLAVDLVFNNRPHAVIDLLEMQLDHYSYDNTPADRFLDTISHLQSCNDIIFATPVYWYAMSGLMKVFFDRLTELITTQKSMGRSFAGKRTWLIATGTDAALPEGFEVPFKLTSEYFSMTYGDSLYFQFDGKGQPIDLPLESINRFDNAIYRDTHL